MPDVLMDSKVLGKRDLKLALFDIDGTLLDKDGHYSQSLKQEILRIQALGVKTAIASGRPTFAAQFLMDELNLKHTGVFCTGAHIYDPENKKSLKTVVIEQEQCNEFLEELRKHNLYYEAYTDKQHYIENDFALEIRDIHAYHLRRQPIVKDLALLVNTQAITKFLIGVDQTIDTSLLQRLESQFPSLIFAYACLPSYPQWLFASVISKEACKNNAFYFLMDHYNIQPDNVISFGDAQSDKTFLQMAGVGVAMGSASDDVKSIANYVTKPSWENGVAYALSRFF